MLDQMGLEEGRRFGYWFDFGDDWQHQIGVQKIEAGPGRARASTRVSSSGSERARRSTSMRARGEAGSWPDRHATHDSPVTAFVASLVRTTSSASAVS